MAPNGLSPPPFREALVERSPLTMGDTWQRWLSAFWQQQATLWQQSQQPHVLGSGAADTLGVWQDASTLTYDTLLHYDRINHRLGVGTTTPTSTLSVVGTGTFTSTVASTGYYSQLGVGITAAYTLDVAGQARIGSLGLGRTPDGAYALVTNGANYLGGAVTATQTLQVVGTTGLAPYGPPGAVYLRSGSASLDSLRLGGGDTVPRWPLDCPGQGHISQLGVYYGPDVAATDGVDVRARWGRIDSLGCGRGPDTAYALVTNGANYFVGSVGTAGPNYFGDTSQLGRTGIAYAPDASHWLRSGSAQIDYMGIGQAANGGYSLVVAGGVLFNYTLYVTSTTQLATYSAVAGAPDSRFVWRMYGAIYCDGIPYSGNPGPWQAYSDRRLKHNIQPIPHALETMTRLRGVLYEYTDTADGKPPGLRMGCIAQEVEEVLPTWVGELSGYKTTQLSQFEALSIESFKELTARVAALEIQLCR